MKTRTNNLKRVLILTMALILSFTAMMFGGCSLLEKEDNTTGNNTLPPDTPIIGEVPSDDVIGLPSNILFTSTTSEQSEGQTLKAVIEPSNAYDQTVDWQVAFVNPESSWAKGKTVMDYVTITPTSDGALTANLKCLEAFGEQIKIIVSSRSNPSATAECVLDYAEKINDFLIVSLKRASDDSVVQYYEAYNENTEEDLSIYNITYYMDYTPNAEPIYMKLGTDIMFGIGTITPEVTNFNVEISCSNGLSNKLNDENLDYFYNNNITIGKSGLDFSGSEATFNSLFGITASDENWKPLTNAIKNNTDEEDLLIKFYISTPYEEAVRFFKIDINETTMVQADSITLNQSNVIF